MRDPRIDELYALCEAEGIVLPLDVAEILELEDAGHVVDLQTGHILTDGASHTVHATPVLEALAHLWSVQEGSVA